jgi:hypothetical protein
VHDASGKALKTQGLVKRDFLMPEDGVHTLTAGQDYALFSDRASAKGAFTFTLPSSWTNAKSPLTFRARLLPPGQVDGAGGECQTGDCAINNLFGLSGVPFHRTAQLTVTPLRITPSATAADPAKVFEQARNLTPLADGDLVIQPYQDVLDPTDVDDLELSDVPKDWAPKEARDSTLLVRYKDARKANLVFDWLSDNSHGDIVVGVISGGYGLARGQLKDDATPYKVAEVRRPFTSIAHELFHSYGRKHASDCNDAGGEDGTGADPWPPDEQGWTHGIGLDRTPGSGAANGPYAIKAPPSPVGGQWYDFMSYCPEIFDNGGTYMLERDSWISGRGWDETQRALRDYAIRKKRLPAGTAKPLTTAQAGAALQVTATIDPATGAGVIDGVRPVEGGALPPGEPTDHRLVARDAQGNVVAEAPMRLSRVTSHFAPASFLYGRVAAPGAASVEVQRAGAPVASRARSAAVPQVSIRAPRGGDRTGAKRTAEVRWSATDGDGDRLLASVDYSLDDGKEWRSIFAGPNSGRAEIPSYLLTASKRARVRVRVNDGFNEGQAVSERFTAVGAPPIVRIVSPAKRTEVAGDADLYLSGEAFQDAGTPIGAKGLTWFDGKRSLGRGAQLSVSGLRPGKRTLRLVARDRHGRTGSASVSVRVLRARPRFLVVRGPTRLRRTARTLSLRIASSVPATLTAGGRRFAVSPRTSRLTIPIRPGSKPLNLPLTLRAGASTAKLNLVVPRS